MGCLRCFSGVKSFHVKIILLDKQELIQEVQESTTGQQLLDNIFTYLNLIETAYFGLRYQDNGNQTVSCTITTNTLMLNDTSNENKHLYSYSISIKTWHLLF